MGGNETIDVATGDLVHLHVTSNQLIPPEVRIMAQGIPEVGTKKREASGIWLDPILVGGNQVSIGTTVP